MTFFYGFLTLLTGILTFAALRSGNRADKLRRLTASALKQIGEGEQIAAEVTAVQSPNEEIGAVCDYEMSFSGHEGLSRKVILPMPLGIGNRLAVGDQVLLRASGVCVLPLLESTALPSPKQQQALPMKQYPADTSGMVLLESDFFEIQNTMKRRQKEYIRKTVFSGFFGSISLLLTIFNLFLTMISLFQF